MRVESPQSPESSESQSSVETVDSSEPVESPRSQSLEPVESSELLVRVESAESTDRRALLRQALIARAEKSNAEIDDAASDVFSTTSRNYRKLGYDTKTLRRLPDPPAVHPVTKVPNMYDPNEKVDESKTYEVRKLLDRRGRPPKLAYLAEFERPQCVLQWILAKDLLNCEVEMEAIDEWKAERASKFIKATVSSVAYMARTRGATASGSGRCFLEAIQACLFNMGHASVLPTSVWFDFIEMYGNDLSNGVRKRDQEAFFGYLLKTGTQLDITAIRPNQLKETACNAGRLKDVVSKFNPGWYIVYAGASFREHCFALKIEKGHEPMVVDDYDEDANPRCKLEALTCLDWISRTTSVRRVQLFTPRKKQKTI